MIKQVKLFILWSKNVIHHTRQLLVGKNTVILQLILWKIYGSTELNIYGIYDENDMLKLHGEIQSAHFG